MPNKAYFTKAKKKKINGTQLNWVHVPLQYNEVKET